MLTPNPFQQPNPLFRRLYIFGAGGFGREVAWLAEQSCDQGVDLNFVVDQRRFLSDPINGIPVSLLAEISPNEESLFVVALGDPSHRENAAARMIQAGFRPATLIHPRCEISRWMEAGKGTVICANCAITCNVLIGTHVHINLSCSVGHDCVIGDFSTLSPGVNLSGNVRLGRGVFIGTNASVINGQSSEPLSIGDGAVVAAGACVTRSVPAGAMVAGVPAVRKR